MAELGKTKRAAATYIVLASLQRFVSLLILPLITHVMPPEEYGAAAMLSSTAVFVTVLVATPLTQLIIRAAARGEDNGPALLRLAGIYCYVIVPLLVGVAAAAVAVFVPSLLGVSGHLWAIELLAIGFLPAASTYALSVAQAHENLRTFVWISAPSVVVNVVSRLLLIVVFKWGVAGWVIADLLSALSSAIIAMILVRVPRAHTDRGHLRHALTFTLPLIPHTASLVAIGFISRPALAAVSTLDQVGLLSFGLSLAQFAGIVITEVNRALLVRYARERFRAPTEETFRAVSWQMVVAFAIPAFLGAGLAIGGPLIFSSAYWPSFHLTGILLIGQAAYGLYMIPMNYLTQTGGITRYSALVSGAGAALILVSIPLFGRTYGAIALAIATAAGYTTMAVAAAVLLAVHKLDIAWRAWTVNWPEVSVSVAALGCAVAALSSPVGGVVSMIAAGGTVVLCLGAALLLRNERQLRHAES